MENDYIKSSILSYSVLSNYVLKYGYSYLDLFTPFVDYALDCLKTNILNSTELISIMKDKFGLEIPSLVITKILNSKYYDKGILSKKNNDVVIVDKSKLNIKNFNETQDNVQAMYDSLINELLNFQNKCSPTHKWNFDETEKYFRYYLNDNNSRTNITKLIVGNQDDSDISDQYHNYKYIIALFIKNIHENNAKLFRYLTNIIEGYLIYSSFNYIPSQKISEIIMNVYLDTPILMSLLGYNGESYKECALEFYNLLTSKKIKIFTFWHVFREIKNLLKISRDEIVNKRSTGWSNRCLTNFISKGISPHQIQQKINNIESDLNNLNIHIIDDINIYDYDIDNLNLELSRKFSYHKTNISIENDVKSIIYLIIINAHKKTTSIELLSEIFVTNNVKLIKFATMKYYELEQVNEDFIAPFLCDYDLATYLWILNPLEFKNYPKIKIISDMLASLEPPDSFISEVLKTAEECQKSGIINENDLLRLKFNSDLYPELMLASEGAIDHTNIIGTIQEVLKYDDERKLSEKSLEIATLSTTILEKKDETLQTINVFKEDSKRYAKITTFIIVASFILLLTAISTFLYFLDKTFVAGFISSLFTIALGFISFKYLYKNIFNYFNNLYFNSSVKKYKIKIPID